MAVVYYFTVPDPAAGQAAAYRVIGYEGATANGPWTQVADAVIADLPTEDVTGRRALTIPDADAGMYHAYFTVSQAGVRSAFPVITPPGDPQECLLTVSLSALGVTPKADVPFTVWPKLRPLIIGGRVIPSDPVKKTTDADGMVWFKLAQGAEWYVESPPTGRVRIDTTGKASIDLAVSLSG